MRPDMNRAADFPITVELGKKINKEIRDYDDQQCHMRRQAPRTWLK